MILTKVYAARDSILQFNYVSNRYCPRS